MRLVNNPKNHSKELLETIELLKIHYQRSTKIFCMVFEHIRNNSVGSF
jgi:hypothetical protein